MFVNHQSHYKNAVYSSYHYSVRPTFTVQGLSLELWTAHVFCSGSGVNAALSW